MTGHGTFKTDDAASYDDLAIEFDRHTQRVSVYAVDALLDAVGAGQAGSILDIGCGSGVVTLAAAKRQGQGGVTTGIDLSDGMLALAREKAAEAGLADRVRYVKDDAERLSFPDASFDAATSLYAFRHFPDPAAAAAEVFRVLKPGGRCAIAVGSGPALVSAAGLGAALARPGRILRAWLGRERAAPLHLDRLVEAHLPAPARPEVADWTEGGPPFSAAMPALLRKAGFAEVGRTWLGREYAFDDAAAFWELQATFSSVARKRIADAPPERVAALKRAFEEDCATVLGRGGRLVYRVGVILVTGTRPTAEVR